VLADHQRLPRSAFEEEGGSGIDSQGDSFFFCFRKARDLARAAVAGQRALLAHSWPGGTQVRVRMGLHTGDASVSENRYHGLAVHRAARICDAGHGGQILLSQTSHTLLEDEEDEHDGLSLREHRTTWSG
jgi:class 3 adenylate cyclase